MAKRDTERVSKRSIDSQTQSLDIAPHNSIKKHKAKERQTARKRIRESLKDEND